MRKLVLVLALVPCLFVMACSTKQTEPHPAGVESSVAASGEDVRQNPGQTDAFVAVDAHSFARPLEAKITHLALDLEVNFKRKVLEGDVTLEIERQPGVGEIVLDTRDIEIINVELVGGGAADSLGYTLAEPDPNLGSALTIALPGNGENKLSVKVSYRTSVAASGLQWLTPEQTTGKNEPFLFTQSQAIHARSWIPLQDTPAVRVTYSAKIKVPPQLRAVMSASNPTDSNKSADGVYTFDMPQAIPSYLIALGVGDLVFIPMSERTGVFAEPSIAKAAAAEFADTEKMLVRSEELYGPYRWGRYDLLILPSSFPFGGMENPRLSFITPTVIAGDKSLVSLIAHELAHSWSGNLVTNATWRDLWLNEGFTSFLTTRIMEAVYGKPRADMEYFLDYQNLTRELEDLDAGDQVLAIDLKGRDPDDVFSGVPYTKGQMFLSWLEMSYGREKFDVFLRKYFDEFSFKSISTEQFLNYLDTELLKRYPGVVTRADVERWVREPGVPDASMVPVSKAFEVIEKNSALWLDGGIKLDQLGSDNWSVHEWLYFLDNLPGDLTEKQLKDLDQTFSLTNSRNNEIAHSWFKHVIRHDYQAAFPRLEEYLVGIGRRKLIVPLYKALITSPRHRQFAHRVYARARPGYHPLAQGTIDKLFAEE